MKFAHLADCHIGSWRDPKLRDISIRAFEKAVDVIIEKKLDFMLISGDLFNTSLPSIESLKQTVDKLKQLKDNSIAVYCIAGSHDFSPSGKTMLDVLESAGLMVNVVRGEAVGEKLKLNFTIDKKTGVKITGMLGRKSMLEKTYYENLLKDNLESEDGYKIFMFHSAITEFKPGELKEMDSHPVSVLPKNFSYYAGGHVHYIKEFDHPISGKIVYPGALFPNNFAELEKYKHGGFYLVEDDKLEWFPIILHDTHSIILGCNHKTPQQVEEELTKAIADKSLDNAIVTIRLSGKLQSGKPSEIDFKSIFKGLYNKSAYFVMKNTSALTSEEFEEIKINTSSVEDIESSLIKEHLNQIKVSNMDVVKEERVTRNLINILNKLKQEGERNIDFEARFVEEAKKLLELDFR